MNTLNHFYTWNTKKTESGFKFTVTKVTPHTEKQSNGSYASSEVMKEGILPTRARAKRKGQQWCKYLKSSDNNSFIEFDAGNENEKGIIFDFSTENENTLEITIF